MMHTLRNQMGEWCRRALVCGAGAALLALTHAPALAQDVEPEVVSVTADDVRHVDVAVSPDGARLVVVWDGEVDGMRRIFVREQRRGVWMPEEVIDREPAGEHTQPHATFDADGTLHLVWIARNRGVGRVYYAVRRAGLWHYHGRLSAPLGARESCEHPQVRVDAEGTVWTAFQAGNGSRYGIWAGRLNPDGTFHAWRLTQRIFNYNLYPQFVTEPTPTVWWYSATNAEFELAGATFDATTGEWSPATAAPVPDDLPANRYPVLGIGPDGLPIAGFWQEGLIPFEFDQVFGMLFEGPDGAAIRLVPDDLEPGYEQTLIDGAAHRGLLAAIWTTQQPGSALRSVRLAWGQSLPLPSSIATPSRPASLTAAPQVALSDDTAYGAFATRDDASAACAVLLIQAPTAF